MVTPKIVKGENKRHDVLVYALSTCVWCKLTKELLKKLGVEYKFIDVDQLSGPEEEETMSAVKKVNPECSFPCTLVDGNVIKGFDEAEIKKALI